jgi:hypothetical protein
MHAAIRLFGAALPDAKPSGQLIDRNARYQKIIKEQDFRLQNRTIGADRRSAAVEPDKKEIGQFLYCELL